MVSLSRPLYSSVWFRRTVRHPDGGTGRRDTLYPRLHDVTEGMAMPACIGLDTEPWIRILSLKRFLPGLWFCFLLWFVSSPLDLPRRCLGFARTCVPCVCRWFIEVARRSEAATLQSNFPGLFSKFVAMNFCGIGCDKHWNALTAD